MNELAGRSFLSPVLIGRARHVEYLRLLLAEAAGPRAVIISGEAGIGKSRLVAEARGLAAAAGLAVLQGNCFDRDAALPYSVLIDLLRGELLDGPADDVEGLPAEIGREIVKLVPELALRCPRFAPTAPLDAEQERRRLFHALGGFFLQAARRRPLLVVLEDLHWANETTLDFLIHCCRQLATAQQTGRVILLMTYRTEEIRPPLMHVLAELDRLRLAVEMPLDQLTPTEMELMVRAILKQERPLRREFLHELSNLTEGNPFFVEEVLKAIHSIADLDPNEEVDHLPLDRAAVPRTVRDAVTRRCGQLSAEAKHVIEIAAVIGQHFDLELLQTVTGRAGDVLVEQIKVLVAGQLVVEEVAGRFRFRHALTREAVYSELLSTERREYHRLLGEAIEALDGGHGGDTGAQLSDLAYHFYEAGVWPKAQMYGARAGERAQDRFAPGACVHHLSHALEAARRLGHSHTPAMLLVRARAYELLGEFNKALADLETALESARGAGDRGEEWEAQVALGTLWLFKDYSRAGDYFEAALDVARAIDDRRRIGHSLNRVGNWQMNVGDPPGALARHQEALAIFRELGDTEGMAASFDLLGMTSYHSLKLADQVTHHRQAVELFRALGDRQGAISSLTLLAVNTTSYEWATQVSDEAEFEASLAAGEEALRESQMIGWRAGEAFAGYALAMTLGSRGRYDRALPLARASLGIAEEIKHAQWQVAALRALGELEIDLLLSERARSTLERGLALARETKSAFWTAALSASLCRALVMIGDLASASALVESVDDERPAVLSGWLAGGARAELALATRDHGTVLDLVETLERAAWPDGRCSRLTLMGVEALIGLKRLEDARDAVDRLCSVLPAPSPLAWRAELLRGRVLAAQRLRLEAAHSYRVARSIIEELAVRIGDAELRHAFLARAGAQIPRSRPLAEARARAKARFDGLTEREREVAALIAAGHSNREIATALFLSERTVAVHVTNVLARLGFGSRTQIAAWATAKGLVHGRHNDRPTA